MESNNLITEPLLAENTPSIDDFLKELEEKERDLHIVDSMIEIDESAISDEQSYLQIESNKEIGSAEKPADIHVTSNGSEEEMQLRRRVVELEVECQELRIVTQRRQKDFENFRQRVERERSETFSSQIGNLAKQILPVLDNLHRALDIASEMTEGKQQDFNQFFDGIVMVNQQLNEVLAEMGVEPIISLGEPFNPQYHEAVAAEKSDDFPPNTVTEELIRGYRIGEKIIRPAIVKVSKD